MMESGKIYMCITRGRQAILREEVGLFGGHSHVGMKIIEERNVKLVIFCDRVRKKRLKIIKKKLFTVILDIV